jgi:hypothetical protein
MAQTPSRSGTAATVKVAPRPDTAIGHSVAAKDHAKAAAFHSSRAEALSCDARKSLPPSKR